VVALWLGRSLRVTPGITARSEKIGEPHSGQKLRSTAWPLSPLSWNALSGPLTDIADFGIPTTTENAVPVCFWQRVQWHTPTNTGSALAEYWTRPQRQPPVISRLWSSLDWPHSVGQTTPYGDPASAWGLSPGPTWPIYARFQIPDTPGQTPNFTAFGVSSFNSALLNENQLEQNYFGIAAVQRSINGADVQLSYFTRYSSVHFVPDTIGDLILNGVASNVFRSDFANGVTTDAACRLNDAHTLRGGLLLRTDATDVTNTNILLPVVGGVPGKPFDTTTFHAGYARTFTPPEQVLAAPTNLALVQGTTQEPSVPFGGPVRAERADGPRRGYFLGISKKFWRTTIVQFRPM
jgi:hypothetical protein